MPDFLTVPAVYAASTPSLVRLAISRQGGNVFQHRLVSHGSAGMRWMRVLLGGTPLAQAVATPSNALRLDVSVYHHGGRGAWQLSRERYHRFSGAACRVFDESGPLPHLLARYEELTGLAAPTVEIADLGVGITRYTAAGEARDLVNSWQLELGGVYTAPSSFGGTRTFQVIADPHVAGGLLVQHLEADGRPISGARLELARPLAFMTPQEILGLRRGGEPVALMAAWLSGGDLRPVSAQTSTASIQEAATPPSPSRPRPGM